MSKVRKATYNLKLRGDRIMKNKRMSFFVGTSIVLLAVFVGVFAQQRTHQQKRSGLGVEIVTDGGLLVLPVSLSGKSPVMHVLTPLKITDGSVREQISALRIATQMDAGKVKVTIYGIYGDASAAKSCSDWKSLKALAISSYNISEGETVKVSELSGVNLDGKQFVFRVVPMEIPSTSASAANDCICAVCNGRGCCPNYMDCEDCGCGPICCFGQ
jgi:hypothetical protein